MIKEKEGEKYIPIVCLFTQKIISVDGKRTVKIEFMDNYNSIYIMLENSPFLYISIDESNASQQESNRFIIKYTREFEKYLLNLNRSTNLKSVYANIMKQLDPAKENSRTLHIRIDDDDDHTREKIDIKNGIIQEFLTSNDGITYHVMRNGDWIYSSNELIVSYCKSSDTYRISIAGSEETLSNAKLNEILSNIKEIMGKVLELIN